MTCTRSTLAPRAALVHTYADKRTRNERHRSAGSRNALSLSHHRSSCIATIAVAAIAAAGHTTVAAAATPPPSSLVMAATSCIAHEYLWASSALALVVAAVATGLTAWTKRQAQSQHGHSRKKSSRAALLWVASIAAAGWGVTGIALSTDDSCARQRFDDASEARWVVTLAAVVASACLVGAAALLVGAALASAQTTVLGQETPPALVCLRCSCCSVVMKRVALLAPTVLLAAVNCASWHESVMRAQELPTLQCRHTSTYFAGAALLFLAIVLAQLVSFGCGSQSQRAGAAASPRSSAPVPPRTASLVTRRRQRLAVFLALLGLSLAAIAWAIFGWISLTRSSGSRECAELLQTSPSALRRSMGVSIALLLLLGWVLLTLTLCCRLEDFIVTSSDAPSVDPTVLSPTLCRSPRHGGSVEAATTGDRKPQAQALAGASQTSADAAV